MTQLTRLCSLIFNTPLLLQPEAAATLVSGLAQRLEVEPLVDIDASRFVGRSKTAPRADGGADTLYRVQDGIALVSVLGELVNRGAWIGASSGLTSYEGLAAQLRAAAADPGVRAIVLDMDSPGGAATGAMETAALVRSISAKKPVVAFVNGVATSAAYAIASGASRIVTTPSGMLGSIGVVWMHLDRSAQFDKAGVKPTLLTKGAYKADGHPFASLPDDARQRIQARLDDIYGLFVDAVAANRKLSKAAVMGTEAGLFMGAMAVKAGLADQVGTLDDVFAYLNKPAATPLAAYAGPNAGPAAAPAPKASVAAAPRVAASSTATGGIANALEGIAGALDAAVDRLVGRGGTPQSAPPIAPALGSGLIVADVKPATGPFDLDAEFLEAVNRQFARSMGGEEQAKSMIATSRDRMRARAQREVLGGMERVRNKEPFEALKEAVEAMADRVVMEHFAGMGPDVRLVFAANDRVRARERLGMSGPIDQGDALLWAIDKGIVARHAALLREREEEVDAKAAPRSLSEQLAAVAESLAETPSGTPGARF